MSPRKVRRNKKRIQPINIAGMTIPYSTDRHTYILRYLMSYNVCPDDKEYITRCVDSLLKKLQDRKDEVDALITVITTNGVYPNKCITIPRTLDGRFQVGSRKDFPHLVYGCIWRWGELQKYDLKHVPSCRFGFDLKLENVCINPYHYERINNTDDCNPSKCAPRGNNRPRKISVHNQCIAENDLGKRQDMLQQPPLQSPTTHNLQHCQDIYQLNREKLIPIMMEHQSNTAPCIEMQQPVLLNNYNKNIIVQQQDPKNCILRVNNNIESSIPSYPMCDQSGYSNNVFYNLHQPAIDSNLYQHSNLHILQSHDHYQNNTLMQLQREIQQDKNNFIQDNRNVNTPPLSLSTCEEFLLEQSDLKNLSVSNDQSPNNCQHMEIDDLPPPTNPSLPNNPSIFPNNCTQQSQEHVQNIKLVNTNEFSPPSNVPLVTNSMFINSNQQSQDINRNNVHITQVNSLPPPSSTPLSNTPAMFPHNLIEGFQPNARQHNQQLTQELNNKETTLNGTLKQILTENNGQQTAGHNPAEIACNELNNKDVTLNGTLEQILAENNDQQTAGHNPTEITFNETLDHILSQIQNGDQQLSNTDKKLPNENVLLDNKTEQIKTQNKIEQESDSDEELSNDNIPIVVSNANKQVQRNADLHRARNIEPVTPASSTSSISPIKNIQPPTSINNVQPPMPIQQLSSVDAIQPQTPISNIQQLSPINDIQQSTPISSLQQLSPINYIQVLSPISNIQALSPISNIQTLSPINDIHDIQPLSPVSNIQAVSSEEFQSEGTTLLLLDGNNKKTTEENHKRLTNKDQLQSDKSANNNAQSLSTQQLQSGAESTSQSFSDSLISFINNNHLDQTQMSSVSKCEEYLRNQSTSKAAPTNNSNQTDNLNRTIQGSGKLNNAIEIFKQVLKRKAELQRNKNKEDADMSMDTSCSDKTNLIPFDDPPLEDWCSIIYFEKETQVGEIFRVKNKHRTVVVDGYFDPDGGDRFCLGQLTNVHRTEQIERTRLHIAQGIALELRDNGDIWLRCKSKNSVFIQAYYLDVQAERPRGNNVHKLLAGSYQKVFDFEKCYKHMKAQIATAQGALRAQQAYKGGPSDNDSVAKGSPALGMNVDNLRRLCILRMSFIKGWGPDYPRATIKEMPCWIEVQIHRALQILDEFLLLEKPIIRGIN